MRVGKFCRGDTFLIGRLEVTVTDVFHNRTRKEVRVLKNDAQRVTQIALLDLVDVDIVVADLTVGDIVEAVDQVRDRGLTCTGRTNESDLLTRLCVQRDIVEDLFLAVVAEVDIEETNVALNFGISQCAVLMRMLPSPYVGGSLERVFSVMRTLERKCFFFRYFGETVAFLLAVNERNVSVVFLRLFVEEFEDTVRTGHRHDDRVHLLGYLRYRHDEGLCQLQERSDNTDGDDIGKTAFDREESADESNENVKDVSDVAHDRHQDIREDVRGCRVLAELFVLLVEDVLRAVFVSKYLNDFLSVDHLFDVAVHVTEGRLLLHEEGGALSADLTHKEDHGERTEKHYDGQVPGGVDHGGERRDDRDARRDHLREALGDHLTECVYVVGVMAHDITVRVRVEVRDRQRLHVLEHITTDISQHVVGDDEHDLALNEVGDNTESEQDRYHADPFQKTGEIGRSRFRLCFQDRNDIIVDQVLDEHVAQNRRDGCHDDADDDDAQ